jgi:hypothetical protein
MLEIFYAVFMFLIVIFLVYAVLMWILTAVTTFRHVKFDHEYEYLLLWLLSPILSVLRILVWPLVCLVGAVFAGLLLLILLPFYYAGVKLRRLIRFLIYLSKGFYAAFRSPEAYDNYFGPLIKFGDRMMFRRDILPLNNNQKQAAGQPAAESSFSQPPPQSERI